MESSPHYASYSLEELLEVQNNIDRDKYPNRAEKVDAEILKRKQAGETVSPQFRSYVEDHPEDSDSDLELLLDFQHPQQQMMRGLFLTAVIIVNLVILGTFYQKLHVPHYQSFPEYLIKVEKAHCHINRYDGNKYYDFIIQSYGYQFYAIDLKPHLCKTLPKRIAALSDVKIWHDSGVIFHMTQGDKVLLSHDYLAHNYSSNRMSHLMPWFFLYGIAWIIMFKSVANAISPGTFPKR